MPARTVAVASPVGRDRRAPSSGPSVHLPPPLRVRALGAFAVWRGDEPIPSDRWSRPTVTLLFKSLLSAPGHRLTRDGAIDLLWPDADPDAGANSLRVATHRLRAVLDLPGASSSASYLRAEQGLFVLDAHITGVAGVGADWLDADAFDRAARAALSGRDAAACRAALDFYSGEYLPDDHYADWAIARREELSSSHREVLFHLATLSGGTGEREGARRALRALLASDPCHEEGARLLMRLLADDGSRGEALRVYDVLARALRDDLGVEPTPETLALRAALARPAPVAPVAPTPPTMPATESVAASVAPASGAPPTETRGNLPAALTSFVGRGRELAAVEHALVQGPAACRLLTVTGIGGAGKTRLALQVADGLRSTYPDGAWLVELAALADPARVPGAIAMALGVREDPHRPLLATLVDGLRGRRLLLLLDNCEHLVAACAEAATALLQACPDLQILATSREQLGTAGETVWQLPPLAVPHPSTPHPPLPQAGPHPWLTGPPDPSRGSAGPARSPSRGEGEQLFLPSPAARRAGWAVGSAEPRDQSAWAGGEGFRGEGSRSEGRLNELAGVEAVRLFLERARSSRPDFTLTERNAEAVAQVCRRLDGLPLAIELAAARLGALSVHDLAARLDNRFRLLSTGNRAALPRHRTLRGVLDWSYDLLSPAEGALLRRLAVFAGGWTLRAAELVCAEEVAETDDIVLLLSALVDKSLVGVQADGRGGREGYEELGTRYRLLETVRQYARERLVESGEARAVERQHADAYLALAERAAPELTSARQQEWLDLLEADHDNLRAALAWARAQGDQERGLRLTAALWRFWDTRGYESEGRAWLDATLATPPPHDAGERWMTARATALNGAGVMAQAQGEYARSIALHEQSLALWRELGNSQGMARSLNNLGVVAARVGDCARADELHGESVAIQRAVGDTWGLALSLNNWGVVAYERGDYERARALHEESAALRRELGDTVGLGASLNRLGMVLREQGDLARATALFEESLALRREAGEKQGIARSLITLGHAARDRGDLARAAALYEESMALHDELGDKHGLALVLNYAGATAYRRGDHRRAAALYKEGLALAAASRHPVGVAASLEGLAAVASGTDRPVEAARLLGAACALRACHGTPVPPSEQADNERTVALARRALGDEAFASAWARGQTLSLEQAVAEALCWLLSATT